MHDKQQKEDIVEIESSQEALKGKVSTKVEEVRGEGKTYTRTRRIT
jgi:hypothetical protein